MCLQEDSYLDSDEEHAFLMDDPLEAALTLYLELLESEQQTMDGFLDHLYLEEKSMSIEFQDEFNEEFWEEFIPPWIGTTSTAVMPMMNNQVDHLQTFDPLMTDSSQLSDDIT